MATLNDLVEVRFLSRSKDSLYSLITTIRTNRRSRPSSSRVKKRKPSKSSRRPNKASPKPYDLFALLNSMTKEQKENLADKLLKGVK